MARGRPAGASGGAVKPCPWHVLPSERKATTRPRTGPPCERCERYSRWLACSALPHAQPSTARAWDSAYLAAHGLAGASGDGSQNYSARRSRSAAPVAYRRPAGPTERMFGGRQGRAEDCRAGTHVLAWALQHVARGEPRQRAHAWRMLAKREPGMEAWRWYLVHLGAMPETTTAGAPIVVGRTQADFRAMGARASLRAAERERDELSHAPDGPLTVLPLASRTVSPRRWRRPEVTPG